MSAGKILVIDDDPQIRRVVRVILVGEGYEVVEARSGDAALLKFRDFLPDLVLLDLNMPGMNGLETCRALRETSDVPIIFLVDQQPIRLDMTFPISNKVTFQLVIFMFCSQGLFVDKILY